MNSSFLSDKKIFVFGLMVACPQKMLVKDCPLEKYRKLYVKEKLNHLEKFSDDREKAIETGCNDYISKPVKMTLLKELIEKHVNK